MKKDNIITLFERLQSEYDIEAPNNQHQKRFLDKLKTQNNKAKTRVSKRFTWKTILGIAATILLLFTLVFNFNKEPEIRDLANVSEEMAETQSFFTIVITEELEKVNNRRTPENELLIKDTLKQVEKLGKEYQQLKLDLTTSGSDKRVIHAMINNFMNRVELLKSVLVNIKDLKNLKRSNNETNNTI